MDLIYRIKELVNSAKEYAELRLKELKITAVEKMSSAFADVTAGIILSMFVIAFIFFINVWAALFINERLESQHIGFLIIGFVWLFFGFIIYVSRNLLIKKPIRNWMIEKIMNNESVIEAK